MKIAICSAAWGRFRLGRIWWKAITRVKEQFIQAGHEAVVVVAGSEPEHQQYCEDWGGQWVPCKNFPLGNKLNTVVRAALADGADYIFITGMDDFYSSGLINKYIAYLHFQPKYFGLRGLYLYEPASNGMMLFQTDRRGAYPKKDPGMSTLRLVKVTPLGAGRVIHKSVFEGHKNFWDPERNQGLDASFTRTVRPPTASQLFGSKPEAFALDVKTPDNIWSLAKLAEYYPMCMLPQPHDLSALPEWPEIQALIP